MMSKFEKRLAVFAIVFVMIYFGAIGTTIRSRIMNKENITRIKSVEPGPGEGQMMLAQLLLPMLIFFALAVCFIIVKKKRAQADIARKESDESFQ